jgi:twitching motility protein PilU
MWRLQNDMTGQSKATPKKEEVEDGPSFTEITLDVRTDDRGSGFGSTGFGTTGFGTIPR